MAAMHKGCGMTYTRHWAVVLPEPCRKTNTIINPYRVVMEALFWWQTFAWIIVQNLAIS